MGIPREKRLLSTGQLAWITGEQQRLNRCLASSRNHLHNRLLRVTLQTALEHSETEEFFILSSGLAGDVFQKCINYDGRIAVYGGFSHYTSKPLHDFIYESSKRHDVFFAATENEAVECLCR